MKLYLPEEEDKSNKVGPDPPLASPATGLVNKQDASKSDNTSVAKVGRRVNLITLTATAESSKS